jgi:DNA-binding LacI/PurR family transcriptional regulator
MTRPTLKDIAARAGVSVSTVSYALNESSTLPLAEQTKTRIRRIARDLGYVPNGLARSLQSRSSGSIGVLLDKPLTTPRYAAIVQGIVRGLGDVGYHPALLDGPAAERCIDDVRGGRLDGVVFIGHDDHEVPPALTAAVIEQAIPFVALDCGGPPEGAVCSTVDFDYGAGVDAVMSALDRRAVRQVLYVRPELGTRAEVGRERAVLAAMGGRPGMTLRVVSSGVTLEQLRELDDGTDHVGYAERLIAQLRPVIEALDAPHGDVAVLCAWGADVEPAYRLAQQVGGGITVASLAAGVLSPGLWPDLLHSRLPLEEAGLACARLIVAAIGADAEPEHLLLQPVLVAP